MQPNFSTAQSIKTIYQAGGHLVLLQDFPASDRRAKMPIAHVPWKRYNPTLDVLLSHPGRLGVVPRSIHCTGVDVDAGDPSVLPPAYASYSSRRLGGEHRYYSYTPGLTDSPWESGGCRGDLRISGYLVAWNNGLQRIAAAIDSGRQLEMFPFPKSILRELLQDRAAEIHVPDPERPVVTPVATSLWKGLPLESVQRGGRNNALFHALRLWSYRQRRGSSLTAWKEKVLERGHLLNRLFPEPFAGNEERQIRDNSYSVSVWCWRNLKWELDHSPARQVLRGRASGASRRKGSNEAKRPWEDQSISRRTWYRHKANGTRT